MKKVKPIITPSAAELARALDLSPADAAEWELRSQINNKIIAAAKKSGLTHAALAKAAGASRPRLTAILNRDRSHVSTDLLLRILAALGYRAKLTFHRSRSAA